MVNVLIFVAVFGFFFIAFSILYLAVCTSYASFEKELEDREQEEFCKENSK